ncbi:inositol monophosphatase 1 [Plakobranchus ocellatus]|uniref:Inositol-1-monophosphatase n=1 Tax=Plakobranchus ocellatus TaxID=259542 RepID=A0AAV3YBZ4_9GAST|nr:inositol monophosphatase 1 [Plakobranchus ocellatus]
MVVNTISDQDVEEMFELARAVALEAGQVIRENFYKDKVVDTKMSAADLVTETDQAIEKMVHTKILAKFPDHKFIGEESTHETHKHELTDDPTWIIDPIDGTTNFVNHIPEVCFSLGIMVNKQTVIGIVYAPIKEELYTAKLGQGSYLNGEKLQASKIKELKQAVILFEGGASRDEQILQDKLKNVHSLFTNARGVRSYGSGALSICNVAAGRGQAFFEYGLHIWDFTAGNLIASEAGAVVTDPSGAELNPLRRRVLVGCSAEVAQSLSKVLTHLDMGWD